MHALELVNLLLLLLVRQANVLLGRRLVDETTGNWLLSEHPAIIPESGAHMGSPTVSVLRLDPGVQSLLKIDYVGAGHVAPCKELGATRRNVQFKSVVDLVILVHFNE